MKGCINPGCINPSAHVHVSVTGRLIFGIFRTLMCEIANEIRFAPNLPPRLWLWTRLGAPPQTPLIRVDNYYLWICHCAALLQNETSLIWPKKIRWTPGQKENSILSNEFSGQRAEKRDGSAKKVCMVTLTKGDRHWKENVLQFRNKETNSVRKTVSSITAKITKLCTARTVTVSW